jgi:hypothetical protein
MSLDMQSRVVRVDHVMAVPVNDELVMADVDAGKYYGFDGIATSIWNLLEKEIAVDALCHELQSIYDVPHERCAIEVLTFIGDLEKRGLIRLLS